MTSARLWSPSAAKTPAVTTRDSLGTTGKNPSTAATAARASRPHGEPSAPWTSVTMSSVMTSARDRPQPARHAGRPALCASRQSAQHDSGGVAPDPFAHRSHRLHADLDRRERGGENGNETGLDRAGEQQRAARPDPPGGLTGDLERIALAAGDHDLLD